jgi:hypothetical protein
MKYSSLETKFSSKLVIMDGFVCFVYRNVQLALVVIATNHLFFRNTCKTENTCTEIKNFVTVSTRLLKKGKRTDKFALKRLVIVPSVTSPGITRPCKC